MNKRLAGGWRHLQENLWSDIHSKRTNWNKTAAFTTTIWSANFPSTRWFKYDRDDLCVNKSQFVPVIFEPPCMFESPPDSRCQNDIVNRISYRGPAFWSGP